jgi:glutamine---fructose-6-phosphate transaminase (isomerizing)
MCGIFGATIVKESSLKNNFQSILKNLFLLSESRGKEASGFAMHTGKEMRYLRSSFSASTLVKSAVFEKEMTQLMAQDNDHYSVIGHSRLVTNGHEQFNQNNQPVLKNNLAVVHNGIIVNSEHLWKKYPEEQKLSDLDSELIPTLIHRFYQVDADIFKSLAAFYREIYGMTSIAMLPLTLNNLILATNNGSIYYVTSENKDAFVFASEHHILKELIESAQLKQHFLAKQIKHLEPNHACSVNLLSASYEVKALNRITTQNFGNISNGIYLAPHEVAGKIGNKPVHVNTSLDRNVESVPKEISNTICERIAQVAGLRRCSKCILPETFPFIEFDEKGVCNYCNNYQKLEFKGLDSLKSLLDQYRSKDGSPDCLMPFSGGRDSSYTLHVVKKELGMNPIAFSYDWGMLTDLGRRNQSRLCGKLGVEHILISADIRKKRENIRKNVLAWLKRPQLGTVPLFMAGDKQYFYYANLLMKQNRLPLSIMGENMLEVTRFKSGFCGVKPRFDIKNTYSLTLADKLKMVLFYGKEYLLNPAYINSSLLDTVDAFKSYYVIKHNNINIYNYIPWEEEHINAVLKEEYDWETDSGTKTTWRIGDGTAAFYNYIYFMVAGFNENDTFRSNQIREGCITREEGLAKVNQENAPRFDSIQWYCKTIGIDWKETLRKVNQIPSLRKQKT